ncbi:hypothetical protein [Pontibacter flavimaris]|uniref:Uncharacterized protein n=1 Tax=Pontibacter flavimaris TaxID=1797110 RepID=A0A1Q5PC70_9BACT|nr:hypothetical protein [Pontibacter flavimaris]OKL39732.1 hypothetical protein A3841_00445 [Pontibacter flavimaris]
MERNERNYQRDSDNRYNRNEGFDNYRDRYSNRHGNYYGMHDEHAEYRNVRSSNPGANSGYRGETDRRGSDYHYGDPNPYMGNRRNEQNGGYERHRGTGWGAEDNYGTYGAARGTNYSAGSGSDRYRRQDNSYQYGGQGRRYEDFNRDEKMYRGRSDHGYNMLGIDAYYDRGEQPERRSDNDFRGSQQRNYYDSDFDNSDLHYSGEIRNTDPGRIDYSQRSSRYRRPGETSGPDYRTDSGASSYGMESPRG